MLRMKSLGPVYAGWEDTTDEPRLWTKVWFAEVAPPSRKGTGRRLRLGRYGALQVGRCRKQTEEEQRGVLGAVGGRNLEQFDPSTIGAWGQRADLEEQQETEH